MFDEGQYRRDKKLSGSEVYQDKLVQLASNGGFFSLRSLIRRKSVYECLPHSVIFQPYKARMGYLPLCSTGRQLRAIPKNGIGNGKDYLFLNTTWMPIMVSCSHVAQQHVLLLFLLNNDLRLKFMDNLCSFRQILSDQLNLFGNASGAELGTFQKLLKKG